MIIRLASSFVGTKGLGHLAGRDAGETLLVLAHRVTELLVLLKHAICDRLVLVILNVLGDIADAYPLALGDATIGWRFMTAKDPQNGRLARPVATDQTQLLSGADVEVDPIQHDLNTVVFDDVV